MVRSTALNQIRDIMSQKQVFFFFNPETGFYTLLRMIAFSTSECRVESCEDFNLMKAVS